METEILPDDVKTSIIGLNDPHVINKIISAFETAAEYNKEQIIKQISDGLQFSYPKSLIKHFITPASENNEIEYEQNKYQTIWYITIRDWKDSLTIRFNLWNYLIQTCKFDFTPKSMYIKRQLELIKKFKTILEQYKDKIEYWYSKNFQQNSNT